MNLKFGKKEIISLVVGAVIVCIMTIGATYAYFTVSQTNNATAATIVGNAGTVGVPVLSQTTAALSMNLTTLQMSKETAGASGVTYYATTSGTPQTTDPNVTFVTASLASGTTAHFNCTYTFNVTGTIKSGTTNVTSSIDSTTKGNIGFIISGASSGNVTKTMTDAAAGFTVTLALNDLTPGSSKTVKIASTLKNTAVAQDSLQGKTISFAMTKGDFSCKISS